jgi:hypothetical protein
MIDKRTVLAEARRLYNKKLAMPQYAEYKGDKDARRILWSDCVSQCAFSAFTMQNGRREAGRERVRRVIG